MRKWNDKTKKIALVAALFVVGIGAFCGIRFTLLTDKPVKAAVDIPKAAEDDGGVVVDAEYEGLATQDTKELSISAEPIDSVKTSDTNDTTQSIQNDPIKTEESQPTEQPAEVTEMEPHSSNEKPAIMEIPADTSENSGTDRAGTSGSPQNGEVSGGKIFIEGFGWIDYNGGGTSGTQADDMYENGNTIGIMD